MIQVTDVCNDCGLPKFIANKHYGLCEQCNYKRLHGGKTKDEVYQLRAQGKPKPVIINKPKDDIEQLKHKYSIKKISNKKAVRDKAMHATYHKIDITREPICEGCGRGDRPLSHSHILSQANRPDLAAEELNIRLHCFGSYNYCHEKWERGVPDEVVRMNDFKDNLKYIQSVDKQAYNAIIANCQFYNVKI